MLGGRHLSRWLPVMKSAHKGTLPTASGCYMKVNPDTFFLFLFVVTLSFPAKLSSLHTSILMGMCWATCKSCTANKTPICFNHMDVTVNTQSALSCCTNIDQSSDTVQAVLALARTTIIRMMTGVLAAQQQENHDLQSYTFACAPAHLCSLYK